MNRLLPFSKDKGKTIAAFGNARLVRQPNGRHLLIGGTKDAAAEAREWCSFFAHEVVFSPAPRPHPALRGSRPSSVGRAVPVIGGRRRRGSACASIG
jgi:hypothetical protein